MKYLYFLQRQVVSYNLKLPIIQNLTEGVMTEYEDTVSYGEHVVEVAWRRGSLEVNEAYSRVVGARVFSKGSWFITSIQGRDVNANELKEKVKSLVRLAGVGVGKDLLSGAEFCRGSEVIGKEASLDELVSFVRDAAALLGGLGEVVLTQVRSERVIESTEFSCREVKNVIELSIFAEESSVGKHAVASASVAIAGRLGSLSDRVIEDLVEDAGTRVKAQLRAKALSPLDVGKWTLILDYDVAGALFHELAHLLEGDVPSHLLPGQNLGVEWLNVSDNPTLELSPARRFFDDEGVRSKPKDLIVDGVVSELLHTRVSAAKAMKAGLSATPGQARGLFHPPKAMHSTLIVAPGDWRLEEIVEETRKGIYVRGLIRAELYGGVVSIVPENAWIIERGEIKEPVVLRQIKIPLFKGLRSIDAASRSLKLRHSYEKGHLVAEVSPAVRILGYIE